MANPFERYQKLALRDSFPKVHQYPLACKELSFILKSVYYKLPKNLQSLIFDDILTAFRLLPGMQTRIAVSAAHLLLRSAEVALPKQRRNLAVKEFKRAMVVHKRRCKARNEQEGVTGSAYLPQDVLVHIFSFLDLKSLVSVGLVCWLWNLAATDHHLWRSQYPIFFGNGDNGLKFNEQESHREVKGESQRSTLEEEVTCVDWKESFKRAFIGKLSRKLTSSRGYCRPCNTIVWLDSMKCPNGHSGLCSRNRQIMPVLPSQVVDYVLHDSFTIVTSSSESDSDSEDGSISRLWVYPRMDQI